MGVLCPPSVVGDAVISKTGVPPPPPPVGFNVGLRTGGFEGPSVGGEMGANVGFGTGWFVGLSVGSDIEVGATVVGPTVGLAVKNAVEKRKRGIEMVRKKGKEE
mmetsp:Transcript_21872/g.33383  ORF Transcript_21872/g.33383 Transcript_21872/m.33383 type:complete len:104 (+) Transcript_21872:137-448(+)